MPAATTDGMAGVVVANSEICYIDGEAGKLVYRGYSIEDLAEHSTFEEVAYLLWKGRLPLKEELDELNAMFSEERKVPNAVYQVLYHLPPLTIPMDALRTLVSYLAGADPEVDDNSPEANFRKAVRLTAKIPTLIAAFHRHQNDEEPIRPRKEGSLAENFLYMLTGQIPDPLVSRTIDVSLILHAEHGMNASTFAGRVASSTLADMHSAVVAAISTLKGPLHGGANALVLRMLREIGSPENAEAYVRRVLEGEYTIPGLPPKRIPGFGHRVYKAWDPRALILRDLSRKMGEKIGDTRWIDISEAVIAAAEKAGLFEKGVYPNVDFFSASTYYTCGIRGRLFTPVFAAARIVGWTAHIMEQHADNKLIRPRANYVGPQDLKWVPVEQRSAG
ncbi:MAG: citrate synthase [Candidatus Poribacteria bacterium]|nr:MAG: citrate synthase [Candidatus Poribacteria bacterium]